MSDSVEQFNQVTNQRRRDREDNWQRTLKAEEEEKRRIQAEAEYRKRKRRVVLAAGMVLSVGVVPSVMSTLLANPDKISVGRLRKIVQALAPDPLIILTLLGYAPKDIRKRFENHAA